MVSSAHLSLHPKRYLDQFSRFCTAHRRVSHYFTVGRYVFPQKFPLPLGGSGPHLTCGTYGHLSSTQTASPSVQPFLCGSQMLCCTMHCQWGRNSQNCPFPLGLHHPAGGGPTHGMGNMHKKFAKDRACGSGNMLADRQTDTHTDVLIIILRYRSRNRSNNNNNKQQ